MDPQIESINEKREITLLDILDSVIDKGVIIKGDLVISIANVDLIYLELKVLLAAVQTLTENGFKIK